MAYKARKESPAPRREWFGLQWAEREGEMRVPKLFGALRADSVR